MPLPFTPSRIPINERTIVPDASMLEVVPSYYNSGRTLAWPVSQMIKEIEARARSAGFSKPYMTVISGYRSIANQQKKWEKALLKYGSAAVARQWVAPPGRSAHHSGYCFDIFLGGPTESSLIQQTLQDPAYAWFKDLAENEYGLWQLPNEPWHWEAGKECREYYIQSGSQGVRPNQFFSSRWGAFHTKLEDWRAYKYGQFTFGHTTVPESPNAQTEPWNSSVEEEVCVPVRAFDAIWRDLGDTHIKYKTLAVVSAALSSSHARVLGNRLNQSTADTANLKFKEAWEGMSSETSLIPSGDTFKKTVESIVLTGPRNLASRYPKIKLGLNSSEDTEPSQTISRENPPFSIVSVSTDPITNNGEVISLSSTYLSSEISNRFNLAKSEINKLGGVLTTDRGRSSLATGSADTVNLYQVGRAFDLSKSCGLIGDPNTDPNIRYLVIRDIDRPESKYTVWGIVNDTVAGYSEQSASDALAGSIIIEKTWNVSLFDNGSIKTVNWFGKAFNLTQILNNFGFIRTAPSSEFTVQNKYLGTNWWSYRNIDDLQTGETTVEQELHKVYTYEQAAVDLNTKHPNYSNVINKKWKGSHW